MVELFGYKLPVNDPLTYLVVWTVMTVVLVAIATKWGGIAVGLAITIFIGVMVATRTAPGTKKGLAQ